MAELTSHDTLPPGPYSVGLTHTQRGDSPPWTVVCGTGQAVAGHIPSRAIAECIALALNITYVNPPLANSVR